MSRAKDILNEIGGISLKDQVCHYFYKAIDLHPDMEAEIYGRVLRFRYEQIDDLSDRELKASLKYLYDLCKGDHE